MRKEKFIYNVNTLSYEKVEHTLKSRLLDASIFMAAVMVSSVLVVMIWFQITESPGEKRLNRDIDALTLQYELLNKDIDTYAAMLEEVKNKDNDLYRMALGVEPVDEYTWESGVGGSDKYERLKNLSNSDLVVETTRRVDKLGRQLNLQSKSLDTLAYIAKEKENMLKAIPSIRPVKDAKNIKMYSGFGMRKHPIHKIRKMHFGIDFTAKKGTPIYATGDGKVISVKKRRSGYGTHAIIDHGFGYKSLYAHMSTVEVKSGQKIKKGEVIGAVGNTGTSTAPHLHYEVIQKGKKVNPIHFCIDGLTPSEYKEMAELASDENQSFDFGGEEFE